MNRQKGMVWLLISTISFFMMSISFLLMPIDFDKNNLKFLGIAVGVMFWTFLVLGIVSQFVLSSNKKNWLSKNRMRRFSMKKKIGLISFCQNLPACVADGLTVIGLIGLIISVIVTNGVGFMCYFFLALFVFSFCMHCILNGKIYYILMNQEETKSEPGEESEKE